MAVDGAPAYSATVSLPGWVDDVADWERCYATDEDRMRLAVALARENVRRDTGGPFGAAVFASSWTYLKRRGLAVRRELLRDEAVAVFDL